MGSESRPSAADITALHQLPHCLLLY